MPRRFRPVLVALVLIGLLGAPAPRAADWALGEVQRHARHPDRLGDGVTRIGRLDGVYSVLVVHGGQLIAESYFREGSRGKPHNLKSASKSVISALVGIAIEDGRIGLDQPIGELLPAARSLPPGKAAITVRHLLTMTSGLEPTSYEGYSRWIESADWVAAALAEPLVAQPGDVFQYSTANTHLLSAALTAATGQSTRRYAEERLFEPIGVTVRGWETDPRGIYVGGNNLSLTPREMARFGELYLRGGRWEGRQVVPRSWVELSTRASRRGLHRTYGTYGYLWWTDLVYEGAFAAVGFGGQYIYVSPPHDTVVVVTSTLESKGEAWTVELFDALRNQILAALGPDPGYYQGRPPVDPALASLASALDRARQQVAALDAPWTDLETFEPRRARTLARVNLRQQPDTDSPRLAVLEHGSAIEILELSQPWLRARAKGLEGWVHADYVRLDEISWRRAAAELRRDLELLARAIEPHLEGALADGGGVAQPTREPPTPAPGDTELTRMAERIEHLETRLAASLAERDEAVRAAGELTARLATTAAELDAERAGAAGLTSQLAALEAEHGSDQRERDRQRAEEVQEAERRTAAARLSLDTALQRVAELEIELVGERRRTAAAETRAAELGTDRDGLEQRLEEAERTLDTERRSAAAVESRADEEVEALRLSVEEAERAQRVAEKTLADERRTASEGLREAAAEIEALEAAGATASGKIETLRAAVEETEAARERAEAALGSERRDAAERLRQANAKIETLEAAVGEAETGRSETMATLESERRDAAERRRQADGEIETLEAAVEQAETGRRETLATLESERRDAAERLRQADVKIEALEAAVDEAQRLAATGAGQDEQPATAERRDETRRQLAALQLALEEAQAGRRRAEEALDDQRRTTAERLRRADEQIEALRAAAETAQTQLSEVASRQTDAAGEQDERIRALEASLAAAEARSRTLASELDDLRAAWLEQQIELEDARRAARIARPPAPSARPPVPAAEPPAPKPPDLATYLAAWAQAWASGSVSDYLAFYADDYPFADPARRASWAARATPSPRPTQVRLRDLQTSDPAGPTVRVRFLLEYRVGPRTISTTKLLDLVRSASSWRIQGETPRP